MIVRPHPLLLAIALAIVGAPHAAAAGGPALPPLPHTVGMVGPDVDLIESGIAAYNRGDLDTARTDFQGAIAIRPDTAIANFDLGVIDALQNDRDIGAKAMRRGFALANAHGMAKSPQAAAMRAIARQLDIELNVP